MKKILTVLLSFLMVATLGIVNVSAEEFSFDNIEVENKTGLTYNGNNQAVFTIKCKSSSGCSFSYATQASNSSTSLDGLDLKAVNMNKDETVDVYATNVGTYYLHIVKFVNDNANYNKVYNDKPTTISKAQAAVGITTPTATFTTNDGKNLYYIVSKESETVTLPFEKSAIATSDDKISVDTKWLDIEKETPTNGGATTYSTYDDSNNDFSFDKLTGKLKISANSESLKAGEYRIKLKATVSDSAVTNYNALNDGATQYINILKVDSDTTFLATFDESILNSNEEIEFGVNAKNILDATEGIKIQYDGHSYEIAPSSYTDESGNKHVITSITEKKVEELQNAQYVTRADEVLNENGEYEINGNENKDALNITKNNEHRITTTIKQKYGEGDNKYYSYTVSANFKVVAKDASTKVTGKSNLTYKGTAQQLIKSVTNTLPSGATVKFKIGTGSSNNNKEAYEAISGDGVAYNKLKGTNAGTYHIYYFIDSTTDNFNDYYGYLSVEINPKSVEGLTVSGLGDVDYDGQVHTQEPTVKDGDKTLTKGTDYTLSYSSSSDGEDCIKAGTVTVTITGKGNYKDTKTGAVSYKINPKSIAKVTVEGLEDVTYTGSKITKTLTVKDGGKTLTENEDYTLQYLNNKDAGTAKVKIIGKGNYTGQVYKKFTINPKSVEGLTVSGLGDVDYDGQVHKQEPTVKDVGTILEKDKDYTLSYSSSTDSEDCIKAGTVTVTITGIGNYKDTKTETYEINAISFSLEKETLDSVTYNGLAQTPEPVVKDNDKVLTKGTDYTLNYASNTNAGTASITVTGNGNYTGTATATFTIDKATAYIKTGSTTASSSDCTYYKNNKGYVTLVSTGVFSEFDKLQISSNGTDFTDVDKENYSTASGSTYVTLKESYLQTLDYDKDYVFKFVYKTANYTDSYPTVTLKVRKYTAPSNNSSSSSSTSTTAKKVVNTAAQ